VPATGRYAKRLGELRSIYQDTAAVDATDGQALAYEVIEYRAEGSDIIFGTTIMQPGQVGAEYFMTRGHFHVRPDRGEVYYTQSGDGLLLLESRSGENRTVEMKPGVCAFIPPDWGHRSINIGNGRLVFVWVCTADAGHDYAQIMTKGMRSIVVARNGKPAVVPNPKWTA
jgi:glucose-6-phosphate isomerase, archaeal